MKLISPRILSLTALGALSLSLAACGGDSLKDTLGYGKSAPDEFAIITKAPLVIPPDFALRPPRPGVSRPQEAAFEPSLAAERALTGSGNIADATLPASAGSPGEQALLANTGGDEANPRIRQVVNSETRSLVEKDKTFTEDVLFWQQKPAPDARTVDAVGEQRRLEQNNAQGKSVTEGDTPSVKPEKQGFFSGLWSSIF